MKGWLIWLLLFTLQPLGTAQTDVNRWLAPTAQTWSGYKANFIFCGESCANNLGLVFDPSTEYTAVSEGVGYGMLMAVLMDDRRTFNVVYDAAHEGLRDRRTELFNWRASNTLYDSGRPEIIGEGSATDSELDIAAALIFADMRVQAGEWLDHPERPYAEYARNLLDAVWEYEVIDGQYLKPGDRFGGEGREIINLSYFTPAWFRLYNEFENSDRWQPLIEQGYASLYSTAGSERGLAPDWSTADGEPASAYCNANGRDQSLCRYEMYYDAIRVPWRIGLDCLWYDEPRACEWSQRSVDFFNSLPDDQTARMYDMQGNLIVDYQDLAMVGMWLFAAWAAEDTQLSQQLEAVLWDAAPQDDSRYYWGGSPDLYYNQSLAWFGAAYLANKYDRFRPN